jgi:hypothetical protein
MTAAIVQFPKRSRRAVCVERDRNSGEWLVIHGVNAWMHASRHDALKEAAELAALWGAAVMAEGIEI